MKMNFELLVVLEESKDDFQEFFINHFGPDSDFKSLVII